MGDRCGQSYIGIGIDVPQYHVFGRSRHWSLKTQLVSARHLPLPWRKPKTIRSQHLCIGRNRGILFPASFSIGAQQRTQLFCPAGERATPSRAPLLATRRPSRDPPPTSLAILPSSPSISQLRRAPPAGYSAN
jgi:hypothetical protein